MRIRDFDQRVDDEALRACVIELQDFEQGLDPRMPPGIQIVDAYLTDLIDRCAKFQGKILVAEIEGEVVGYAAVMTRVRSEELEDGGMEYGLVADLMVLNQFRRRGIGRRLLEAAIQYASDRNVRRLRVGVLAANRAARRLYGSLGFQDYLLQLEKHLTTAN